MRTFLNLVKTLVFQRRSSITGPATPTACWSPTVLLKERSGRSALATVEILCSVRSREFTPPKITLLTGLVKIQKVKRNFRKQDIFHFDRKTECSSIEARSVSLCALPRTSRRTRAGWLSTCSSWASPDLMERFVSFLGVFLLNFTILGGNGRENLCCPIPCQNYLSISKIELLFKGEFLGAFHRCGIPVCLRQD